MNNNNIEVVPCNRNGINIRVFAQEGLGSDKGSLMLTAQVCPLPDDAELLEKITLAIRDACLKIVSEHGLTEDRFVDCTPNKGPMQ